MTKILVIIGPTASGKSDLAVELALQRNGEVVSADSRQVYRGLDLGTGKITRDEMRGVPHHCLDIADPSEPFTVEDWRKCAERAVADIAARGRLPIICGGTGFYVSALIDGLDFPAVAPNPDEQKALEEKSAEELFRRLKELDPERAAGIDKNNKRRLSRAILIAGELGRVPRLDVSAGAAGRGRPRDSAYDPEIIGIDMDDDTLKRRIHERIVRRLEAGMVEEVSRLHSPRSATNPWGGLSWQRLDELGLEYRYIAEHLQGMISEKELVDTLDKKTWQYVKRQRTWWKRDERVGWRKSSA